MTSIIILTCNHLTLNRLCVESIRSHIAAGMYELIVVDNGSRDGTVDWLQAQPDLKVILNGENRGFPAGCNQGIRVSTTGNDILLLNNDAIATPRWLENLSRALHSSPEIGAVGPVANACSYYQTVPVNYCSVEELQRFAEQHNWNDSSKWEDRLMLAGFCLLIKADVVAKVGQLDERFTPGLFEDHDYSFRIRQAGYRLVLCKDTFIHHEGSKTFKGQSNLSPHLAQVNGKKFSEKWGFDPLYSTSIRRDLVSMIRTTSEKDFSVLDLGCACGGTLLEIKNRYPNSRLSGVESNPNVVKTIGGWARVRSGDVEDTAVLMYPVNSFDYIICADVLEHLRDPWAVLRRVWRLTKPGGTVIASVPNVMHFTVIRGLLNGFWEYTDCGILDRTHLRFFTFYQIQKMFTEAGFGDLRLHRTLVQKKNGDTEFIRALCSLGNSFLAPLFETFQFVVEAVKPAGVETKP